MLATLLAFLRFQFDGILLPSKFKKSRELNVITVNKMWRKKKKKKKKKKIFTGASLKKTSTKKEETCFQKNS